MQLSNIGEFKLNVDGPTRGKPGSVGCASVRRSAEGYVAGNNKFIIE